MMNRQWIMVCLYRRMSCFWHPMYIFAFGSLHHWADFLRLIFTNLSLRIFIFLNDGRLSKVNFYLGLYI